MITIKEFNYSSTEMRVGDGVNGPFFRRIYHVRSRNKGTRF